MKTIVYALSAIAIVATAPSVLAQTGSGNSPRTTITNGVNTIGTMNGAGSGVGVHNPQPTSPSVYQEPTRPPSYGDRGNIKFPSQGSNSSDDD